MPAGLWQLPGRQRKPTAAETVDDRSEISTTVARLRRPLQVSHDLITDALQLLDDSFAVAQVGL